jgi:YfiH family protein
MTHDGRPARIDETLRERFAAAGLDWIVPDWDAPAGVGAFSTTKRGRDAGGFDLGPARVEDAADPAAVAADRARLDAFLPSSPVWLRQVHGTRVVEVDAANRAAFLAAPPEADAAVTFERDVVLAVRTADCLPVLIAHRVHRCVAVAHAGWRGLAAGVLEATVKAMDSAPDDLVAWIGPAIGPRAFEVGRDVVDAFVGVEREDADCFAPLSEGKWLADLPELARRRLARAGVGPADVGGGDRCTVEDAARFHSHRRDRSAGRMATVAWKCVTGVRRPA